ncbi:helix-turn-helix transcriptional regulator [Romboutsia sedimentorum]|uniref:helix-turn-helix transcriptional regulator n=1 Tax=Romboutsia sedimentorum TaxID=1368474 RepID=UPI0024DE817E|nr:helix-turn-helix transcriptional regulator [Romboutsia sedimentorum]MDK2584998.1 helix-turn-helix transcriptional regulator [Romboutsia sedimentorum]
MGLRLLKAKRALLGLTQNEVANMMGINCKSYNFKENGRVGFSLDEVIKISSALNLSLEDVNDIFLHINLPKGNKIDLNYASNNFKKR